MRRAKLIRIGDPLDESTQMSSLINKKHRDRVVDFIEKGINEGGKLICGGPDHVTDDSSKSIVKPTIFIDCSMGPLTGKRP